MNAELLKACAASSFTFFADLNVQTVHGLRRFGGIMAPHQREWLTAIEPALLALARGERPPIGRYWWEGTKGSAKDYMAAVCLLWLLLFSSRPMDCQIGAADQDQADEVRKAAREILHANPWLAKYVTVLATRVTCETTGSTAEIIPADAAGSHGSTPDLLILNELSHIANREFAENLMDNAAKVPGGLVLICTNAGMLDTWQWNWREIARESAASSSPRWSFHRFDKPAPWIDPAEIEEARRRNSNSRFMRLWFGVWSAGEGDALDPADIDASIVPGWGPMGGLERDHGFVLGIDLGIKRDHSAAVVLGFHGPTQRIRLAEVESWAPSPTTGKVDLEAVFTRSLQLCGIFNVSAVAYDVWQMESFSQQFARLGLNCIPVAFTGKALNTMATTMLETFRNRTIDLYNEPSLIRDLKSFTIEEKSYGHRLVARRTKDGHADRGTAFALALPYACEGVVQWCEPMEERISGNLCGYRF